jgi:hypothetical protein
MTDYIAWQQMNDHYLATALSWIRFRLERLAPAAPAEPVGWFTPAEGRKTSLWERMTGRAAEPQAVNRRLLPPSRKRSSSADSLVDADEWNEEIIRLESADPPPALMLLGDRLGLSRFERLVLLLAVGMELDTRIGVLCARAQDDPNRPFPTFALAMALFEGPSWDVLSPERPLRYWRLLEITQPAGQPLTASALRADERIVNYIKGLNYLDDRLASGVVPMTPIAKHVPLPPSHVEMVQLALDELQLRQGGGRVPLVQLAGGDAVTRELVAVSVADALGLRVYRLMTEAIPIHPSEVDGLSRLWDREAALLPLALFLEAADGEGPAGQALRTAITRFTSRARSLVFLSSREQRPSNTQAAIIEVRRATSGEQRQLWRVLTYEGADDVARRLSGQFDLSLSAIQDVTEWVKAGEPEGTATLADRLWKACLAVTRPELDRLAQRIDVRAGWEDLVLPADQLLLLRQIVAQVAQRSRVYDDWGFGRRMNRGLGISALFSGESGTGKSMAAEVIARDLQLDLYRIDLSQVVNKYIGETEKNLRRVFDAAEEGGAILLFDEADALFGKRSEVKDSHDRYANIEINYLLQRLEAYRGLAILTTNMRTALDHAFLRRLRFVVEFPFPSLADRRQLWQGAFPPDADLGSIDIDRLARLNLTGGSIHNIALNAAFLAAHADSCITMTHVLRATRTEFRKLERPINEAEFRLLEPAGAVA